MAQEAASQADISALAESIKKAQEERQIETLGGKENFCAVWPNAEHVLNVLESIVGFVPGFGFAAKAAIAVVRMAGKATYSALDCRP